LAPAGSRRGGPVAAGRRRRARLGQVRRARPALPLARGGPPDAEPLPALDQPRPDDRAARRLFRGRPGAGVAPAEHRRGALPRPVRRAAPAVSGASGLPYNGGGRRSANPVPEEPSWSNVSPTPRAPARPPSARPTPSPSP